MSNWFTERMKTAFHHCIVHPLWLVLPTAWWEHLHDWSGRMAYPPEPPASPHGERPGFGAGRCTVCRREVPVSDVVAVGSMETGYGVRHSACEPAPAYVPKAGDEVVVVEVDTIHTAEWIAECAGQVGKVVDTVYARDGSAYVRIPGKQSGVWCTKVRPTSDEPGEVG